MRYREKIAGWGGGKRQRDGEKNPEVEWKKRATWCIETGKKQARKQDELKMAEAGRGRYRKRERDGKK